MKYQIPVQLVMVSVLMMIPSKLNLLTDDTAAPTERGREEERERYTYFTISNIIIIYLFLDNI